MAKWGEGDPRWIVEERPDATNVNNWHWTEKNACEWSKNHLEILFKNLLLLEENLGMVTITNISKCEGEATANNRKGKLIFFYEWNLEMEWIGNAVEAALDEIKGRIEITNFSEENDAHEIEIDVHLDTKGDLADKFKEFIRKKGIKQIRDKVGEYIENLKKEYGSGLILPTKSNQATTKSSKTMISQELLNNVKNITVNCKSDEKSELQTTSIQHSQTFKCGVPEMYNVFTNREMVIAFTRNDVEMDAKEGGKFELFGGNVCGEFTELIVNEKIAQKWRFKSWPEHHFSEVVLLLSQESDCTRVDMNQSGIPVSDVERTRIGWQNYYWDSIKRTFGFGAQLS